MSDNSEKMAFETLLDRLRRRQRLRRVCHDAVRGALAGAVAGVCAAVMALVVGGPEARELIWTSATFCAVGALFGAAYGALRRVDPLAAARALDRAASSEDRFASALQLAGHRRSDRAALVLHDALAHARDATPEAAIPLRAPRALRWLPVPVAAIALLAWLAPRPVVHAVPLAPPEVSAEEWAALSKDLREDLDALPEPKTDQERELAEALRRLAELFEQQPSKKDALAEIARLQDALEKQRAGLSAPDLSLRQAAAALQSSEALGALAAALRTGEHRQAADELRKLAERLRENSLRLSAEDFESMAADFERFAEEVKASAELSETSQACAGAASSLNREKLAASCQRMAQTLDRNANRFRQCDSLRRSRSLLDDYKRRLSQCQSCRSLGRGKGCKACQGAGASAFLRRGEGKGGLRAGWGTAEQWAGGRLSDDPEQRMPVLTDTPEGAGAVSAMSTVSPEERAESVQDYKQAYADLVRKAEADLALESVPAAYREYLRRYFVSIKPADDAAEGGAGE